LIVPYGAYIGVSSYIYINFFGLSATAYSYYFAINAACSILGPFIYLKIYNRLTPARITELCFLMAAVSGILLVTVGKLAPVAFLIGFIPFTVMESVLRPAGLSVLLDQQEGDTGSASSLINFVQSALWSFGLILGVLPWSNYIDGLGISILACTLVCILSWIVLLRSKITVKGLKQTGDSGATLEQKV